jgi:large conductance mechanosensitive channel
MLKGFRDFLLRGSLLEIAVAFVMGAAFGAVVNSFVSDVFMPLIGLLLGQPDFSTYAIGPVSIGKFLTAVVNFILIGAAIYFLIVAPVNAWRRQQAAAKPAEPPPPPSEDTLLLREIRDALAKRT